MTDKVFVERRPQGDYAVRLPNSQRASGVTPTQAEAIALARKVLATAQIRAYLTVKTRFSVLPACGGGPSQWGSHREPSLDGLDTSSRGWARQRRVCVGRSCFADDAARAAPQKGMSGSKSRGAGRSGES